MRVVLDTNIFISGVRYGGKPETVLRLMTGNEYTLILSDQILEELEGVLLRKFAWTRRVAASTIANFRAMSEVVAPDFELNACVDPDDNRILEAAVAGNAAVIVSGDKHLLSMKSFRDIEILTVDAFLKWVGT
jgi:putative PIN family toxin of toxin-antitoxin system